MKHLSFTCLIEFLNIFRKYATYKNFIQFLSVIVKARACWRPTPFLQRVKCIKRSLLLFTVRLSLLRLGWDRGPSAAAITCFKENIVHQLGTLLLGKIYIWEVAAFPSWGRCHLGNFHLGNCTFGKLPHLGKGLWEIYPRNYLFLKIYSQNYSFFSQNYQLLKVYHH